ncbi:MAG: M28 family peptidase [Vicinamibacterales bacterium]
MVGATSSSNRQLGSSDYTAFNAEGLPGINLIQEPIQYQSHTWHGSLDTYERIIEEDATRAAIVVACAACHLSFRDELLPRFSADDAPRRPRGQP